MRLVFYVKMRQVDDNIDFQQNISSLLRLIVVKVNCTHLMLAGVAHDRTNNVIGTDLLPF